jgi:hypothetical protein
VVLKLVIRRDRILGGFREIIEEQAIVRSLAIG